MLKRIAFLAAILIALPTATFAETSTERIALSNAVLVLLQGSIQQNIAWDQAASSLTVAQGYSYAASGSIADGSVTNVACSGTVSPFTCTGKLPAQPVGTYTASITASNGTLTSAPSNVVTFTLQAAPTPPAAPTNLRLTP